MGRRRAGGSGGKLTGDPERLFLLRVAVRLGFPTLRHFEAAYGDMTGREVVELMALERMDPAVGTRLDHLFAVLCAVVANSRMAGKGAKSFKPADFLPDWSGQRRKKSLDRKNIERILRQAVG